MSEVVTGKKNKLITAISFLNALEEGKRVKGILKFTRKGRGKVVGQWRESWDKRIEFRLKRMPSNDILEYRTDRTGWTNEKYGSPYRLLCGEGFELGATKHRLTNILITEVIGGDNE